ncbi:MAG: hypothetical protein GY765_04485 [bacterium]|nr:hypothetical protein [bacterium]
MPEQNHALILQLVSCLTATGQCREARELISQYMTPEKEPEYRYYAALNFARQGNIDDTIEEIGKVLKKQADHPRARELAYKLSIYKARREMKGNRWMELSGTLARAIELAPDTPEAKGELNSFKDALPLSYVKAGKRAEAANLWQTEFDDNPTNFNTIHNLAVLYYWWARKRENDRTAPPAEMNGLWTRTMIYWVALVHMDDFWQWWTARRGERCNIEYTAEHAKQLRESFLDKYLSGLFSHYMTVYKQEGNPREASRHQGYIMTFLLEKKSAQLRSEALELAGLEKPEEKVPAGYHFFMAHPTYKEHVKKLEEAIISLASAEAESAGEAESGLGLESELQAGEHQDEAADTEGNGPAGSILPGHQFAAGPAFPAAADETVEDAAGDSVKPRITNDMAGRLRLYYHPDSLGLLLILIEELKAPDQALLELDRMPAKPGGIIPSKTPEGRYIRSVALTEKGNAALPQAGIEAAIPLWEEARALTDKPMEDPVMHQLMEAQKEVIDNAVTAAVEASADRFVRENKVEPALQLLENIVHTFDIPKIKEYQVELNCRQGAVLAQEKKYILARKFFNQALNTIPHHPKAQENMAASFNREALDRLESSRSHMSIEDYERVVELLKVALEYAPENITYQLNMARSFSGAATLLMKSTGRSAVLHLGEAIFILEKGIHVLNPSIDPILLKNPQSLSFTGFDQKFGTRAEKTYKKLIESLREANDRSMK